MKPTEAARAAKKWHDMLANYFVALPMFVNNATGWNPDDQPTIRRAKELAYHLVQAKRWDDVETELCDVRFVESVARTEKNALNDLHVQYEASLEALGGNADILARRERYRGEDGLVHWTPEARQEERDRIERAPTLNDKLRNYRNFTREEKHRLARHGSVPGFTLQAAYNSANAGPVARSAEGHAGTSSATLVLLREDSRPEFVVDPPLVHVLAEHQRGVAGASVYASGKRAISWSFDETLRIWDLSTGKRLQVLGPHSPSDRTNPFAGNTRLLTWQCRGTDYALRVWDLTKGCCQCVLAGHNARVGGTRLYRSETRVLSWSSDNTLRTWELESGAMLSIFEGHAGAISGARIFANETRLLTWGPENSLQLWDLEEGECLHVLAGHGLKINGAIPYADGRRVLSWSQDKTLRIWDCASGECLHVLRGHAQEVRSAELYASDTRAVTRGPAGFGSEPALRIWNLETGTCEYVLDGHRNGVFGAKLYREDFRLFSWDHGKTLQQCDLRTGEVSTIPTGWNVGGVIQFAQGQRVVAWGSMAPRAGIWDLATGERVHALEGHKKGISSVEMFARESRLLTRGQDRTLRVWDLKKGACTAILEGHADRIVGSQLFANDTRVLTWSEDRTVRVWDLETGDCLHVLEGHTDTIREVHLYANETHVLTCAEDGTLRVWCIEAEGSSRALKGHEGSIRGAELGSNNERIVTWSNDRMLRLWDAATGRCLKLLDGHAESDRLSKPGVEGAALYASGARLLSWCMDLCSWDLATGQALQTIEGHWIRTGGARIYQNETRVLSWGGMIADLRIWSLSTGECLGVLQYDRWADAIEDTELSQSERYAVSWTHTVMSQPPDYSLRIWDLTMGTSRTLEGHTGPVRSARFCLDDRRLLSRAADGTLRLWDVATLACVKVLDDAQRLHTQAPILFSEGTRVLGWDKGHSLRVWELETGECVRELRGHTGSVEGALLCDDETCLLSWSWDGSIRVWDMATGTCRQELLGHESEISGMLTYANDTRMLSWSRDGLLRTWDLATGSCLHTLVGHGGDIFGVRLNADETRAHTWGHDDTLRVWDLMTGTCLQVVDEVVLQTCDPVSGVVAWEPKRRRHWLAVGSLS